MARRILLVLCVWLLLPAVSQAQAVPGSRIGWTQAAATLADAQALTYRAYLDGSTTGTTLTTTCAAGATATTFACSAPIPAVTPGPHGVTLSAANAAGESPKSGTLSFTMLAVPNTPIELKILP